MIITELKIQDVATSVYANYSKTVNIMAAAKAGISHCTCYKILPGLLTKGVLLLHDNAHPHTANKTNERLRNFNWEVLEYPPYSPNLAPSDFHLFGPLKHHFRLNIIPMMML
ncbi:hypothetical protein B7P43_G17042 [Cryptotermes secundus]|uniref:Tc1-like transposase DDE domain-containing protein n=1 Tax=Cryptotermes secundus TaxID=105785 RepID=A0A2J7RKF3_9NEOP|nr:hypothetical protein B7P43_G17042 [Cryptotermes secundus]